MVRCPLWQILSNHDCPPIRMQKAATKQYYLYASRRMPGMAFVILSLSAFQLSAFRAFRLFTFEDPGYFSRGSRDPGNFRHFHILIFELDSLWGFSFKCQPWRIDWLSREHGHAAIIKFGIIICRLWFRLCHIHCSAQPFPAHQADAYIPIISYMPYV